MVDSLRYQCRQHDDYRYLRNLRRLESHSRQVDPSCGSMGSNSDNQRSNLKCTGSYENRYTEFGIQMIVYKGYHQHKCYAARCKDCLSLQEIHCVIHGILCTVTRCRVHQQKSESRDEYDGRHQTEVKEVFYFLFLSQILFPL